MFTLLASQLLAPAYASAPAAPAARDEVVAPLRGQARELDILCANLWGLAWPLSRDRGERLSAAPEALGFDRYDLVGLQEIWRGAIKHLPDDSVRTPEVQVDSGLALAGRLADDAEIALHTFEHSAGVERFKRKGVLVAQLDVPDFGPVWTFVTHLQAGPPYGETRLRQAEELLELVEAAPGPALIVGDFNLHHGDPMDGEVEALLERAGLRDAALVAGDTAPTYTQENPYIWAPAGGERFDRVYLKDGGGAALELVEFEVLEYDQPLSDHQPVRVKLRLSEAPLVATQ